MILELQNVKKSYGKTLVLDGVDLRLEEGEIMSILGYSGSGKSTILNIIAGFEKIDEGSVTIANKLVTTNKKILHASQRDIGMVFQDYALFPHITIEENITFGLHRLSKKAKKDRCADMLKLIGLSGLEDRYPHELSGGQAQRVAIARTLATSPRLVLFDEIFSNTDGILKAKIQSEIVSIIKNTKVSAIFVNHDVKEAMRISDKIAFMQDGKIMQCDSPKMLYSHPKNEVVARFFGDANIISHDGEKYCIRPEDIKILQNMQTDTEIATVQSVIFLGDRQEVSATYVHQDTEYTIYLHVDKEVELQKNDIIKIKIDYTNSKMFF